MSRERYCAKVWRKKGKIHYQPPVKACHGYSSLWMNTTKSTNWNQIDSNQFKSIHKSCEKTHRSMVKSRKYAWNNCFLLSQNSMWKSPWNEPGSFSSVASTSWSIPCVRWVNATRNSNWLLLHPMEKFMIHGQNSHRQRIWQIIGQFLCGLQSIAETWGGKYAKYSLWTHCMWALWKAIVPYHCMKSLSLICPNSHTERRHLWFFQRAAVIPFSPCKYCLWAGTVYRIQSL